MIGILALYALCASTFTISKMALAFAAPFFYVGVRMSVAGILLLGWEYFKNSDPLPRYDSTNHSGRADQAPRSSRVFFGEKSIEGAGTSIPLFIHGILFHIFFAYTLDLWSLQYMSSAESALIYNLAPFLSALFSYFVFHEKMTNAKWLGLFLGCISAGLLISPACITQWTSALPYGALLGAVASSSWGWVIVRELVYEKKYSPFLVNGVCMLGGGILSLILSACTESWHPIPVSNYGLFALLTGAIIISSNILFYNFYGFLLRTYTATFLAAAGFTCPLFAAYFGTWCGEALPAGIFPATILVALGLMIFYREELRQGYIQQ